MLRWTLAHRWKTVSWAWPPFVATIVALLDAADDLPADDDHGLQSASRSRWRPAHSRADRQVLAGGRKRARASSPRSQPPSAASMSASANLVVTLKDRPRANAASNSNARLTPTLNRIADARVHFRSQQGGGSGRVSASCSAATIRSCWTQTASKVVDEMATAPELSRLACNGELQRPEIPIKPRLDLAADLGVTTSALSQTIRIATLGEIDQNSAKFSLSDRQIPIRVALERGIAPRSRHDRESAGPHRERRLGAAEGRGRHRLRRRADRDPPRSTRRAASSIGADLAPGTVSGDAMHEDQASCRR